MKAVRFTGAVIGLVGLLAMGADARPRDTCRPYRRSAVLLGRDPGHPRPGRECPDDPVWRTCGCCDRWCRSDDRLRATAADGTKLETPGAGTDPATRSRSAGSRVTARPASSVRSSSSRSRRSALRVTVAGSRLGVFYWCISRGRLRITCDTQSGYRAGDRMKKLVAVVLSCYSWRAGPAVIAQAQQLRPRKSSPKAPRAGCPQGRAEGTRAGLRTSSKKTAASPAPPEGAAQRDGGPRHPQAGAEGHRGPDVRKSSKKTAKSPVPKAKGTEAG